MLKWLCIHSHPISRLSAKNLRRKEPTAEQKKLREFLKTHTVQLVGYDKDGTPVVKVVKK